MAAIRVALAAARDGETVVPVVRASAGAVERHQVIDNLQYLPPAVFAALCSTSCWLGARR
ncbi:MAG: hypothetical protein ABIO70_11480 [Pseudomonadota bacterium]